VFAIGSLESSLLPSDRDLANSLGHIMAAQGRRMGLSAPTGRNQDEKSQVRHAKRVSGPHKVHFRQEHDGEDWSDLGSADAVHSGAPCIVPAGFPRPRGLERD